MAVVAGQRCGCEKSGIEGFEVRQNIERVGADAGRLGNEEGEID